MSIKQVAAIRRKPGMTHHEFCSYVRNIHGALAAAEPLGVTRYVQNHVVDGAYGSASDSAYAGISGRDLVTELFFADQESMVRTFSDPYVQNTIRPDGAKFNDFPTALSAIVRETPLQTPVSSSDDEKIWYYLKLLDRSNPSPLETFLQQAHTASLVAVAEHGTFAQCIANVPLTAEANSRHFGGPAAVTYDAILMYRVARGNCATLFRTYVTEFERQCGGALDRSLSFFLFARETVIFENNFDSRDAETTLVR